MEHFAIIQALCRGALASPSNAVRKQMERLVEALTKDGEEKQAASLKAMLASAERNRDVAPSRLTLSRGAWQGEELTPNTPIPVDKETSAPLAEIIFPTGISGEPPIFNDSVSCAVESIVEDWAHFEELQAVGVSPGRSCLIYGAPGTGKTRLALWMSRKIGFPVVSAKLDGLMSSFLGTTSRNIGNLFAFANRYQCVLLLDEFDAIAKLRDDPQEVGEIKRVVNALLQNLDVRKDFGFTLGLTNHPALLDPAVWRRFEVQLEVPKPDFKVRVEIARSFMAPLASPESHIKLIAWFTDGMSGAEIEMLVRTYKKTSIKGRADEPQDLLSTLKQFATLNAARVGEARKSLLFADPSVLFRTMKNDEALDFSLADIGEVAGKDKSTVSRHLGRQN